MSALRKQCPVCAAPKERAWHLVCPGCWAKVPGPQQVRIYGLYKRERGSLAHRVACMETVKELYKARQTAGSK